MLIQLTVTVVGITIILQHSKRHRNNKKHVASNMYGVNNSSRQSRICNTRYRGGSTGSIVVFMALAVEVWEVV